MYKSYEFINTISYTLYIYTFML